ncbi:hypothetical protein SLS58_006600 [Diplodia intermedia]|uniref:Negative regulator of differentiation 1 n=1 Tax=Diplodia intermedia TaxID=856260 RepID=A0ABR3TMG7_9PEZI
MSGKTPPYDPFDSSMVRIAAREYDLLRRTFTEYCALRKTLLDNGVEPSTLEILMKPPSRPPFEVTQPLSGLGAGITTSNSSGQPSSGLYDHIRSTPCTFAGQPGTSEMALGPTEQPSNWSSGFAAPNTRAGLIAARSMPTTHRNPEAAVFRMPEPFEPEHAPLETGTTNDHDLEYTMEPNARHKPSGGSLAEKRSLNITDLSPTTSLNEIVASVKGGMLVEIFRANDRAARVSFRHFADAQAFCNYARRNDIYINNKRVTVDWADRQLRLNAYVHGKILQGATRILRLRGAIHRLTEQNVRLDMEHIDNLAILDVRTQGNDLVMHTNSVQHCISARNCMMTRKPYKSLKIDFERDYCDEPLPQPVRPSFFDSVQPASQQAVKSKASVNIYGVLDLDPEEDEEDDSGPWQAGRRDSGLTDDPSICEPRRSDSDPIHYA